MDAITNQMHDMAAKMMWVHAYAEWVEANAEYQEALADNRNGESYFPGDLAEAEYQADLVAQRAWRAIAPHKLQSLAEWAATPGGQEYMDQAPDGDLLREIGEHDAARVAPRHPGQPYYYGRQFRSV